MISKRLNRMNFSTSCTILVTFGPETPEFMQLTTAPFVAIQEKLAYHVKYLRISWTYLDLLYRFGRLIVPYCACTLIYKKLFIRMITLFFFGNYIIMV